MALSKKAAIRASAAGLVALVGVVVIGVELARSDDKSRGTGPVPGTYAEAPEEVWSFKLEDDEATVMFATDDVLVLQESVSTSAERLTALDLDTGEVAWQQVLEGAYCGARGSRYAPDANMVVCDIGADDELMILDPQDGSVLGRPSPGAGRQSVYRITGDTIYTCAWSGGAAEIMSGTASNLSENFAIELPQGTSGGCTMTISDDYIAGTSTSNWTTVVDRDGTITYQTFDMLGKLNPNQLLETQVYVKDDPLAKNQIHRSGP